MSSTITITAKVREPNFGYPQESTHTHIAVTMIPTRSNTPTVLPVVTREQCGHWSDSTSGRSGHYVKYSANLPDEFSGLRAFDERAGEGDYVAQLGHMTGGEFVGE